MFTAKRTLPYFTRSTKKQKATSTRETFLSTHYKWRPVEIADPKDNKLKRKWVKVYLDNGVIDRDMRKQHLDDLILTNTIQTFPLLVQEKILSETVSWKHYTLCYSFHFDTISFFIFRSKLKS